MNAAVVMFAAWTWIIPPTVGTVGQVMDGVTTYRSTHGMTRVVCEEANGIYNSKQPGVGRIVAVKAMPVLATWLIAVMAKRNPGSQVLRTLNWVNGAGVGVAGLVPAVHDIAVCGW